MYDVWYLFTNLLRVSVNHRGWLASTISFETCMIAVVLAVDDREVPSSVFSRDDPASPFVQPRGEAFLDCSGCLLSRPWLELLRLGLLVSRIDEAMPRSWSSRVASNSAWRNTLEIIEDSLKNRNNNSAFFIFQKQEKERTIIRIYIYLKNFVIISKQFL